MSLFGIGGPAGVGGLNGVDCMIMESDKNRDYLKNQYEQAMMNGLNSDAVILELTNSDEYINMIEQDQRELIKAIEEINKMRR